MRKISKIRLNERFIDKGNRLAVAHFAGKSSALTDYHIFDRIYEGIELWRGTAMHNVWKTLWIDPYLAYKLWVKIN